MLGRHQCRKTTTTSERKHVGGPNTMKTKGNIKQILRVKREEKRPRKKRRFRHEGKRTRTHKVIDKKLAWKRVAVLSCTCAVHGGMSGGG